MSQTQWDQYFSTLEVGQNLEPKDVQWCMKQILEGNADTELIKKFLIALKTKGTAGLNSGHLLTHFIFHPVEKSHNQRIQIVYTLKVQAG